ncbi:unnamed protein product [Durusdinium trenchii]|uniref:Uncharacterized protein n=1 Tax=Durusdinium trenchii TaxID=1381693 RepID=A0ABP0IR85_9DINO
MRRGTQDGKYITLNALGERLDKEALTNPAIEVQPSPNRDYFEIRGRGEMQLGILIEEMRREGYEMSLSPPTVVKSQGEDGTILEPWEDVQIEVDLSHGSQVMERMSVRGAKVQDMNTVGDRQTIKLEASTSSMLGLRSWLKEITGGTATVVSDFKDMRPQGPKPPKDRSGVLVANTAGTATSVDLGKAARLGKLFIAEGIEVYPGMIFGENNGMNDIDTNIARKHDGYQTAANFQTAEKRLEEALSYILDDEKLEVTPKRIAMRKAILDANERRIAAKAGKRRLPPSDEEGMCRWDARRGRFPPRIGRPAVGRRWIASHFSAAAPRSGACRWAWLGAEIGASGNLVPAVANAGSILRERLSTSVVCKLSNSDANFAVSRLGPRADGLAMESTRPKHHLGIRCDAAAAWEREREQHSEAYFAAQLAQRRRIHAACFKLQRWWKQELLRRKLVYENMMDAMQLLRDLAAIKVQSWWRARQGLPPFTAPSAPGSPGAPLLAPGVERRALRVHGEAAHGGG